MYFLYELEQFCACFNAKWIKQFHFILCDESKQQSFAIDILFSARMNGTSNKTAFIMFVSRMRIAELKASAALKLSGLYLVVFNIFNSSFTIFMRTFVKNQ